MRPKPKEWTEAEKQALARLVRDGASVSEIKTKLKRHAGSVRRMVRKMSLMLKSEDALRRPPPSAGSASQTGLTLASRR
jgi:transposase